jgi:para-nitrobenzyl esterase
MAATAYADDFEFGPNVDGWALPDAPGRVFAAGQQHNVPLLIGANADEWTTMRPYYPEMDRESFRGAIQVRYGDLAEQALALYPVSEAHDLTDAIDHWMTDDFFICPSRFMARSMDKVKSNAYFYLFTRVLPGPGGERLRAYHGAEIAYVFDNLEDERWVPREAFDDALAEAMSSYWVAFAATGHPNREGLPPWPVYDSESDPYLELGAEIKAGAGIRSEACSLYERDLGAKLGSPLLQ